LAPTRSREGARPRLVLGPLLAGFVLLASAATGLGADDDPDGPGPLPWRVRGRVGFTVDAASFPDSVGQALEMYVRMPPVTLAALERDSSGTGRLKLSVRLTNRFGARSQEANQEFAIAAADTVPGFGKVVLMRFPVKPGGYRLQVKLEDLISRKRGLGYLGRKVTESASVNGELTVPASQAGRDLSDLEFVWPRTGDDAGSAFRRGEHALLPNPERLYGLLASELRAEFAARGLADDQRTWYWHARVLDDAGRVVAEQESTAAPGPRLAAMVALDLSTEPSGAYDLEVKAWQEGDAGALIRSARFSIGWRTTTWLVDPSDVEDLVHFLLSAEDEHRFSRFQPGERERFLEEFWRRRDPTPETADNESRNEFLARVDHANENFGGPGKGGRGMFSDMGRVYIRYGEPGEILKQVIPTGDETLLQAIRDIELSEDRPTGDVHQKGLGGDTRAYEVWVYEGDVGAPPDSEPNATTSRPRRRLVFLFVDEHGYGNYTLRYSTE
jgi:GWxTD domain-containing protein